MDCFWPRCSNHKRCEAFGSCVAKAQAGGASFDLSKPRTDAAELADRIAGFPRVRLCHEVDGTSDFRDFLLHERDRHLIVQALRGFSAARPVRQPKE